MALRSKFAIEINNILVKQAFYILNWHFDLSPLKRQSPDPLKYYCTDHARKRKRKDKEQIKKSRTCRFVVISDGHSLVKSYFFWEILGKRKTPFLLFLCYTLRRLYFITWAERQVKDSRRSGMSQSCFLRQDWARKVREFSVWVGYLTKWERNLLEIFRNHFELLNLFVMRKK